MKKLAPLFLSYTRMDCKTLWAPNSPHVWIWYYVWHGTVALRYTLVTVGQSWNSWICLSLKGYTYSPPQQTPSLSKVWLRLCDIAFWLPWTVGHVHKVHKNCHFYHILWCPHLPDLPCSLAHWVCRIKAVILFTFTLPCIKFCCVILHRLCDRHPVTVGRVSQDLKMTHQTASDDSSFV